MQQFYHKNIIFPFETKLILHLTFNEPIMKKKHHIFLAHEQLLFH